MIVVNMVVTTVITLCLPVVWLILWKRKNKNAGMASFVTGAAVFVVVVMLLEQKCHQLVLNGGSSFSVFLNRHNWAYILYGAGMAGIFEETGRYLAFRCILKREKGKEDAIAYGIGHGGTESMLVVGLPMFRTLAVILAVKASGGADRYALLVSGENWRMLAENLNALLDTPAYVFLLPGIERMIAMVFHTAMSVLVFLAAKRPGKWHFYPLAVFLHIFFDIFPVMYRKGLLQDLIFMEVILAAVTAGSVWLTYRIYRAEE